MIRHPWSRLSVHFAASLLPSTHSFFYSPPNLPGEEVELQALARKHNRAQGTMVVPSAYLEVVIDVR